MQEARSIPTSSGTPVRHPSDTPETARKPKLLGFREPLRSRHMFPYSFATHPLEDGYDIRTVQELFGHKYMRTTMIYTHVLKRGPAGVRSAVDGLLYVLK